MSSEKKCCVPGCSGNSDSRSVLHLFPNPAKDIDCFKSWLFNIGGDILAFNNEYIYKNRRVCHAHFESKYCCRNNRISKIAVPTLNLPALSKFKLLTRPTEVRACQQLEQNMSIPIPVTHHTAETEKEMESILPENKMNYVMLKQKTFQQLKQNKSIPIPVTQHTTETEKGMESILPENKKSSEVKHKSQALKKVTVLRSKLTKTELKLYNKLVEAKAKLSKYKNKAKNQAATLKSARNLFSNDSFIKALKNMPSTGRLITLMQFRESKKKDKGRRFSEQEKHVSLAIMKQSPKTYRFLRKIFVLPSPQTLGVLLSHTNIE